VIELYGNLCVCATDARETQLNIGRCSWPVRAEGLVISVAASSSHGPFVEGCKHFHLVQLTWQWCVLTRCELLGLRLGSLCFPRERGRYSLAG
jgi:hypothetical protein